jgi:hypothetical protein
MKILIGNRNQCQGCKEYFNSNWSFDKHRTGDHGVDRRCRTHEEMIEKGLSLNEDGFWIGKVWVKEKMSKVFIKDGASV